MMNQSRTMQQWMQNQSYLDSLSDDFDKKTNTSDFGMSSEGTQTSLL